MVRIRERKVLGFKIDCCVPSLHIFKMGQGRERGRGGGEPKKLLKNDKRDAKCYFNGTDSAASKLMLSSMNWR